MADRLSRNAELVKFFAQAYPGIPRTRLVKFIYMADVLAREYLARPLSTLSYRRDKYGPYDPAVDDVVEELIAAGHAEERREGWGFGAIGGAYKRLYDLHRPVAFSFSLPESAVLDYIVTNYVKMGWKEFLNDVVYESPPVKSTPRKGTPLPMESLDGAGTARVGFRLDEVLQAEEAGRRGDVVTLSAFMDELRAQAPA